MKKLVTTLSAITMAVACSLQGQVSYDTQGGVYSEDFDALLGSFDSFNEKPWVDNETLPGWYASRNGYIAQGNPTTTSQMYNFRLDGSSTDMALGSVPGAASGDISFGFRITNNTGSVLTGFNLQYAGEQWRNSGNERASELQVSIRLGGDDLTGGSWTVWDEMTFSAIHTGGTAGNLNGDLEANRQLLGATYGEDFSWAPGQDLWIRWTHADIGGTNHALGVDDVTFAAIPEPGHVGAILAGLSAVFLAVWRKRFRK